MKNKIISISLAVALVLGIGLIGCGGEEVPEIPEYNLAISSTEGGEVTTPGEGTFTYDEGAVVDLVAQPDEDYHFVKWTGNVATVANVNAASTAITMNDNYSITASFAMGIYDWYDLNAIRDNLGGSYVLMNDLDSTTGGYQELASAIANEGKGWQPIGTLGEQFTGSLDGQGYEIRDLFVDRPDEDGVGLFGWVDEGGIENLGVVNAEVAGHNSVGGLVGANAGTVNDSYSTGSVIGEWYVGGLVGGNGGTVSDSYSTGDVTGNYFVGGLVGIGGTVSNSYSTGSVTGDELVGGLVGVSGTVSNSHYNYDEVLINRENVITIGALSDEDFEQWLANGKSLDVNDRLSQEDGYYLINDVNDFKQLLAFGQDDSLKFKLKNDLDLGTEADFYIPYLAGEFDGNGHKISNLSFNFDFIHNVGLFGYLTSGGKVSEVCAENVNITGRQGVGCLVGRNEGTVSNSYATGSVTGYQHQHVGGLVGVNRGGFVVNSYYNYDEVLVNGESVITIGALSNEDFEQWLANDKFLDVNERLSQEDGYYVINDVRDFKQLLAFGQYDSLKFRLKNDLDLATEPDFYVPYLAGEFDGDGHKISNLSFHFNFVGEVGLFGHLASGGKVTEVGAENVNIVGDFELGGLVGFNDGTVSNSYSTGSVAGSLQVGGLVGWNWGTVSNSYSTGSVIGGQGVGGLVGWNLGTVSDSYSTGRVTGDWEVGGLVGFNVLTVSNSFWDIQTSGQSTSAGEIGKTTAEMKSIATFSGAAWDIIAVAHGETNPTYTWNIIDGETYPFLSWQAVS